MMFLIGYWRICKTSVQELFDLREIQQSWGGGSGQGSGFVPAAVPGDHRHCKGLSQSGNTLRWDLGEQFWPWLSQLHHTRKALPPCNALKSVAMGIVCCWCFGLVFILFIADRFSTAVAELKLLFNFSLNFFSCFVTDLNLFPHKYWVIFSLLSVHFQTSHPTFAGLIPELHNLLQELQPQKGSSLLRNLLHSHSAQKPASLD